MDGNNSFSPELWVWMTSSDADSLLLDTNSTWPYTVVSKSEFYSVVSKLINQQLTHLSVLRVSGYTTSGVSIVFSALLIGTFWKKTFVEKNAFFAAMTFISLLDLLFCIFNLFLTIWFRSFRNYGSISFVAMWAMLVVRGLVYTTSLASDMCALFLTLERYMSVVKPHIYQNLRQDLKQLVRSIVVIAVLLVSATRMSFSVEFQVELAGDRYIYTESWMAKTPLFLGLVTFCDGILPFVLLISMLIFSSIFCIAVLRRSKNKVGTTTVTVNPAQQAQHAVTAAYSRIQNQSVQNTTKTSINQEQKSIFILVISLDVLFILNQLLYCMLAIEQLLKVQYLLSYNDSVDRIKTWCLTFQIEKCIASAGVLMEMLTRTMNLLIYVSSSSIRKELEMFVKKLFKI